MLGRVQVNNILFVSLLKNEMVQSRERKRKMTWLVGIYDISSLVR